MPMKKLKLTSKQIKRVTNAKQIQNFYYHLGSDKMYYRFKLDEHSLLNIGYFIKKRLIFIKQ